MPQEFSGTESRIVGALSKLDNFLPNSQVRVQSETIPETSLNYDTGNREYNEDRSQNDPNPEVGISVFRSLSPWF